MAAAAEGPAALGGPWVSGMCGIVGLFLKSKQLEPQLGSLVAAMLGIMSDRGPDSAGFAIYGSRHKDQVKFTLRLDDNQATREELLADLEKEFAVAAEIVAHDTHSILSVPVSAESAVRAWLLEDRDIHVVGTGLRMELYKDVGRPDTVARRFDLASMCGTHAIGHTRMATESLVTTDGAHPFSTGLDQCLVHNGSLSNHNALRRMLIREGLTFETENDSEVAAGYLTWRMREGSNLRDALKASLEDLDGFYTFVAGTETGFAVLRDPIACKPAVMAETDDYVAFGSEYRALVNLPDIEAARVFEPEPATVYVWERN
jgi:methylamine---glutamate N-methyltransferase subunit A